MLVTPLVSQDACDKTDPSRMQDHVSPCCIQWLKHLIGLQKMKD